MHSKYQTALLVLKTLNDGFFHSGNKLAQILKISRTTVYHSVQLLKSWGLDIYSIPGKGYQLPSPIEFFKSDIILKNLEPPVLDWIEKLTILPVVNSTNTYLLEALPPSWGRAHVCLAETQLVGRGRSTPSWVTPFGRSLACSLACPTSQSPQSLSTLSLLIGMAVVKTLQASNLSNITLKWPNDLWYQGAKLGGILVETKPYKTGALLVIGVGLNIKLTDQEKKKFQYPVTDLETIAALQQWNAPFSRNCFLSLFLTTLYDTLNIFEQQGFLPFQAEWDVYDALRGKMIVAHSSLGALIGQAAGITQNGLLKIISNGVEHWVHHADVSIKLD